MAKAPFSDQLKNSSQIFGSVGSVFGFISDVIQPLAPFIHVATTILAGATGVLFFCFIFRAKHPYLDRAADYFTQGLVLTVVLLFFWFLGSSHERGFFADNFEFIAGLQNLVLGDDWAVKNQSENSNEPTATDDNQQTSVPGNTMHMHIATHELRLNPTGIQDHLVNANVLFKVGDYTSAEAIFDSIFSREYYKYDLFERYYEVLHHNYRGNKDSINLKIANMGLESNPMMQLAGITFMYDGLDYYIELGKMQWSDPLMKALAENIKARSLQADLNHYYLYENYVMDYWIPRMRQNENLLGRNLINLRNMFFDYPTAYRAYKEATTHPYHGHTIWEWHSYDPGNTAMAERMWNRIASGTAKQAFRSPTVIVSGVITDESGSPLQDVVVTDLDTFQPSATADRVNLTSTNEDGRFTIRTGKGHMLRIEDSYGSHELREKFVVVKDTSNLKIVLSGRSEFN